MSSSLSSSLLHHSRQISVYFFSSFSNTFITILLLGGLGKHPCVRIIQLIQKLTKIYNSQPQPILGDPGVTSRDVAIFLGESLLQGLKSPWELVLTEPVPEVVEFCPADWPENYFPAQSARRSSRVTLSPSYTMQFSSSIDWKDCRGEFPVKNIQ